MKQMNILVNVVITILAIAGVCYIWARPPDWIALIRNHLPSIPLQREPLRLDYGIVALPSAFEAGIEVHGVVF